MEGRSRDVSSHLTWASFYFIISNIHSHTRNTTTHQRYGAGEKYTGDWNDNKKDGFGTQTWVNGDKYEGDWAAGRRQGKGTFWVQEKGKLRKQYTGDWQSNKCHGLGVYYYPNFDKYEGEWVRNRRHGRGKLIYADGRVYEGDFAEDERYVLVHASAGAIDALVACPHAPPDAFCWSTALACHTSVCHTRMRT